MAKLICEHRKVMEIPMALNMKISKDTNKVAHNSNSINNKDDNKTIRRCYANSLKMVVAKMPKIVPMLTEILNFSRIIHNTGHKICTKIQILFRQPSNSMILNTNISYKKKTLEHLNNLLSNN